MRIAILCFATFYASSASAQWAGFTDASTALDTGRFTFNGSNPDAVGNENYYDGDFADFDGDGLPDRLLGARYGLLHNQGGGYMVPFAGYTNFLFRNIPIGGASGWGEDGFQWSDVDGDGDYDAISGGNGEPLVVQINDAGRFRVASSQAVSALNIVNTDVENDGDIDLIVAHAFCWNRSCGGPERFALLINDGSGGFSQEAASRGLPYENNQTNIVGAVSGDVNGDGYFDIVLLNGDVFGMVVAINDQSGSFTPNVIPFNVPIQGACRMGTNAGTPCTLNTECDSNECSLGEPGIGSGFSQGMNLGDVDGDGDLDLVMAHGYFGGEPSKSSLHASVDHSIWINSDGLGGFVEESATRWSLNGFDPTGIYDDGVINAGNGKLLDVDYDGDLDFIASHKASGLFHAFLNDGSGNFSYSATGSSTVGSGDQLGADVDITDLDGDGSYDVWLGFGGGSVSILLNSHQDPSGLAADVPRNLQVVDESASGITLQWEPPPFASAARHYRVYRATAADLERSDRELLHIVGHPGQDEAFSAAVGTPASTAYLVDPQVTLGVDGTITFQDDTASAGVRYFYSVTHVGAENAQSVATDEVTGLAPALGGGDSTPPDLLIHSPTGQDWSAYPRIVLHYGDEGGVDTSTLSVTFDADLGNPAMGGRAAGSNVADLAYRMDGGVAVIPLVPPLGFTQTGLVTMDVSVDDMAGNTQQAQQQFVVQTLTAMAPTATASASVASGNAPLFVSFDGTASADPDFVRFVSGRVLSWEWYFGDGTSARGQTTTHTFQSGGAYDVLLIVRDNEGGVATSTMTITVNGPAASCSAGEIRSCYSGATGTSGVGPCVPGLEQCSGGVWGSCTGEVVPTTETCDGADNDCSGTADDPWAELGMSCVVGVGACVATGT